MRVPVDCNCLLTSIDWFAWSKPSLRSLHNPFFIVDLCLLHLLDVIASVMWGIYKTDIRICFSGRLVEGCVKGSGFVISLVNIN